MKLPAIVALLLLALLPLARGEANDTTKDKIVLHTQLQNYEQPTLRDFEECHKNRDQCFEVCQGTADSEKCELECPLCPELRDQPLLVQGINDTSFVPPAQTALNTTNIIKLTNEIHNVIKNDLRARNEINVTVQQNVSQVGGRFGLGYSELGSCCYVVRHNSDCEHKENCKEHSRQRVCGERCQARVMIAKRVVQCDAKQTDDCHETVEYVPARKHRSKAHRQQQQQLCAWPNVNCNGDAQAQNNVRVKRSCSRCLKLSFEYILQHGLPANCSPACFQGLAPLMPISMPMPMYYMPMAYGMPQYGYNAPYQLWPQHVDKTENTAENDDSDWQLETEKCLNDAGVLEDCPTKADKPKPTQKPEPPAHLENGESADKEPIDDEDKDYVEVQRRKRRRRQNERKFMRSLYSHRHDKQSSE
ncbi:CG3987 [Drosophila busckii]|uniref:CG3987 n=1 Tax=Drosophila busckii TaxID=30019 RepID=A0A0M4ER36_DROBS|nr:uncharacterized protein LOC108601696 [Drosophila busckii]ALC46910.1 CG3987 [Drosophila busckii]